MLDFLINQYGDLESIATFMKDNSVTNIDSFDGTTKFTVKPTYNEVLAELTMNKAQVVTGLVPTAGDFNDDFNEDFKI